MARTAVNHLSEATNPEVYRRLSEGVFYAFGAGVEGDIAEFGSMIGRTAAALAASLAHCEAFLGDSDRQHGFKTERRLWLFDSFEGLPDTKTGVDKSSPHVASGVWGKGTCRGLSPAKLSTLVSRYISESRVSVIKGCFKDTVPKLPEDTKFSVVHIDGDLYESAVDVLDNLFARSLVSKGALILFDDWNCNLADPGFGERRAWKEMVERYCILLSDEGGYGTFGHRFIVHDYDVAPKPTRGL